MGLKPGYKQTEVGVIPSSWVLAELQEVCREPITYGIVQCGPHVENGVPYIRVSDMNYQELDVSGMLRTSPAIAAGFSRSMVQEGDIVYALRGKIGEVRRVGPTVAGANLTQGTARLSPNDKLRTAYLLWALRGLQSLRQAELAAKGSTFREITLADLRRIQLPIPSPAEQEAIAEALSDADALIESLEQLLTKKCRVKQGAMQELLSGKRRLPGFSKDWVVVRLGDVADTDPESLRSDTRSSFTFNYIALEDVNVGTLQSYSQQMFRTAPSRARRKLRRGDVLVSTVRPNLMSHLLFPVEGDNWVCSTGFCVVRCREGVSHPGYVYFHMFAGCVARQIEAVLTGSNYPAINGSDVRALQIPFPDYEEQTAIAAILFDMDAEIAALEAKLIKARQIKQGMMQELLTGRIRLV